MRPSRNLLYFHPTRLYTIPVSTTNNSSNTTLIQQRHYPSQVLNCPTSSPTHGTSLSQCVITPAACPSNNHRPQSSISHMASIIYSSIPLHSSSRSTKGGRDTNARVRSTTRCSPGEKDVNQRAADSSSVSRIPGVDQARGPREKRTSQRRAIFHFPASLLLLLHLHLSRFVPHLNLESDHRPPHISPTSHSLES